MPVLLFWNGVCSIAELWRKNRHHLSFLDFFFFISSVLSCHKLAICQGTCLLPCCSWVRHHHPRPGIGQDGCIFGTFPNFMIVWQKWLGVSAELKKQDRCSSLTEKWWMRQKCDLKGKKARISATLCRQKINQLQQLHKIWFLNLIMHADKACVLQ